MNILYYTSKVFFIIVTKLLFRIKIYGTENIPKSGGFIYASNHIGYFDPPFVGTWGTRYVYFLAKKELFKKKFFAKLITRCNALPISRKGFDRRAIETCVSTIKNGNGLTIFPEGTRSKTEKFLDPKPGVGLIAYKANCPIVPVFIHGTNKFLDCFLGKEIMIISYGKPLSAEWISSFPAEKESYVAITQAVMGKIKELKEIQFP